MNETSEGGREEGRGRKRAQLAAAPSAAPSNAVQRLHRKASSAKGAINPGSSRSIASRSDEAEEAGLPPVFSVRLSALRYGLEMFRQSGGSLRKQVLVLRIASPIAHSLVSAAAAAAPDGSPCVSSPLATCHLKSLVVLFFDRSNRRTSMRRPCCQRFFFRRTLEEASTRYETSRRAS